MITVGNIACHGYGMLEAEEYAAPFTSNTRLCTRLRFRFRSSLPRVQREKRPGIAVVGRACNDDVRGSVEKQMNEGRDGLSAHRFVSPSVARLYHAIWSSTCTGPLAVAIQTRWRLKTAPAVSSFTAALERSSPTSFLTPSHTARFSIAPAGGRLTALHPVVQQVARKAATARSSAPRVRLSSSVSWQPLSIIFAVHNHFGVFVAAKRNQRRELPPPVHPVFRRARHHPASKTAPAISPTSLCRSTWSVAWQSNLHVARRLSPSPVR